MSTDHKTLFKAAWEKADGAACVDVLDLGLREAGDDFREWVGKDVVHALVGYFIVRDRAGLQALDEFSRPIGLRLAEILDLPQN